MPLKSSSFLGTTSDRDEALPGIKEIDFKIEQDRHGQYRQQEWQRTANYSKSSLPSRISCVNPRCQQGGLATQNIVLYQPDGVHEFWCNGHEGSPGGRRQGDPCDNGFKVTLAVKRSTSNE